MTAMEPRLTCSSSSSSCLRFACSSNIVPMELLDLLEEGGGSNWSDFTRSRRSVSHRTTVSSRSMRLPGIAAAAGAAAGAGASGTGAGGAPEGSIGELGGGAVAGPGGLDSADWIQSSIARSSPWTHFFRIEAESLSDRSGTARRRRPFGLADLDPSTARPRARHRLRSPRAGGLGGGRRARTRSMSSALEAELLQPGIVEGLDARGWCARPPGGSGRPRVAARGPGRVRHPPNPEPRGGPSRQPRRRARSSR